MRGPRRRAAQGGAASARHRRALFAAFALALAANACGPGTRVPRVIHGRTVEGPFVSEEAYAAYARGAYLEQRGQRAAAIEAYRAALAADGEGAAIWTRLGALYCRERPGNADDAFEQALKLAPGYVPAWSGRAECRMSRGELDGALADALRAVALAPDDSASNLLVARVYREQRRLPEAKAWLFALVLRSPGPSAHWQALAELGAATDDAALVRHARLRLSEHEARRERTERPANDPTAAAPRELLDALRAQDLPRARTIAARLRIDARALALLAAVEGHSALAAQQAELVLAADPSDPDALIAALDAALATDDGERLAELLRRADVHRRPGALGARLLGELLRWLVGEQAAQAWTEAYGTRATR